MPITYSQIGAGVVAVALGLYYVLIARRRSTLPGPRGYPIVGNIFDLPKSYAWLHYAKFKDLYGAVKFRLRLQSQL
jgi:hypothetical protein